MTNPNRSLNKPPIVEAVLDIDCDLPTKFDLRSTEEAARKSFATDYPDAQLRYVSRHELSFRGDAQPHTLTSHDVRALMFRNQDGTQLVQVRDQGYSFNRLAPYSTLDDYLPEVRRTWSLFVDLVLPLKVTAIRLRYVNRINLALSEGSVDLNLYFRYGPNLPNDRRLRFEQFLSQYVAMDAERGNEVKSVLASQKPSNDQLPVIFDITAGRGGLHIPPDDWHGISEVLGSLRDSKNHVFFNTLTEEACLPLFR